MRKIFLSWCFALVFFPGVLNAQEQIDYTARLLEVNEQLYTIQSLLYDEINAHVAEIEYLTHYYFNVFAPLLQNISDDITELKPRFNSFFDDTSMFYESFKDDVKPAILDIQDASLNIQQDTHKINENLIQLYNICNPFFAVALDKFYDRVTFDNDSLKVTDIELRNKITDSNQELQKVNGGLDQIYTELTGIYRILSNQGDIGFQLGKIQDVIQDFIDLSSTGGDGSNSVTKVLEEWGFKDFGEDFKESKDNLNSAGEDLNFTIVGYDETTATIETNMHTRSFGRTVSKDNWFEQVQDFLLIISKASQSQAMSGQLNYLINYENYKNQKDVDKEKQEYEDRISELEQQVGELNQSFSDLEDLITYFSQPSEKKEVFTKFQTELQNIRLISNELPQYIKLGEFPASWQNISVGGDLSININDFHPFFRACNSIFGFIYYSLITLFLIWLFSKVPLIIKPLLSLVKSIMTWK